MIGKVRKRQEHETQHKAETRIKGELIENGIINDFIENNVASVFDSEKIIHSRYNNSTEKDKKQFNDLAFKIVADDYQRTIKDHPRLQGIDFTNYVKLFNKKREWRDILRKPDSNTGTPAYFFWDTFNEDVGLFRNAVLAGYKSVLEEKQGRQPPGA